MSNDPAQFPNPDASDALAQADEVVAVVPRAALNYVIIAVVFFAVGALVGIFAYDRLISDRIPKIIEGTVSAAIANLPVGTGVDTAAAPVAPDRLLIEGEGNPWRGTEDAIVTMVEFADFQCGFCKRFNDMTIDPILEQYAGRIRHVYRDYPVLGAASIDAAVAAQCAYAQDRFWEYHGLLFNNQTSLTRESYLAHAETLGLDVATFTTCYDDQETRSDVISDYSVAENLGVTGTPTFFINGKILVGAQPLQTFQLQIESAILEAERANAS